MGRVTAHHRRRVDEAPRVERRRGRRRGSAGVCLVAGTIEAVVLNVGCSGIGVETRDSLGVGRSYPLTLQLDGRTMRTRGVVHWCSLVRLERRPNGDVLPIFRAGLEIPELTPDG